jgi:hypothetical protein
VAARRRARKLRSSRRKFLAAREDVVDRVSQIAKLKHLTLFGLVNEALEQMAKAHRLNRSLSEIIDEYEILNLAKSTGSVILPGDLWRLMLESVGKRNVNDLLKAWHETGRWYGTMVQAQFSSEDKFKAAERVLKTLLWGCSDLAITRGGDSVLLRCIGPRFSQFYTNLLASFMEGMLSSYGYSAVKKDISRGVIILTLKVEKS